MDHYGDMCGIARALPDDKMEKLHTFAKRLAGHRGPVVQTATGRSWRPDDPRAEEVCDEDIAAAISRICRFGGHLRDEVEIYTVAEHSVRACRLVREWGATPDVQLQALVHDAHEAYPPGDVIAPVKHHSAHAAGMREMERMAAVAVREHFGVPAALNGVVREADLTMLATERRDLLVASDINWGPLPDPMAEVIVPWSPRVARLAWNCELEAVRGELRRLGPADVQREVDRG